MLFLERRTQKHVTVGRQGLDLEFEFLNKRDLNDMGLEETMLIC